MHNATYVGLLYKESLYHEAAKILKAKFTSTYLLEA